MTMPLWAVILIIVLVLAVIFSNVMLVKKTAHMKMPNILKKQKSDGSKSSDWQEDEWDKDKWGPDDWQKDDLENDRKTSEKSAKK